MKVKVELYDADGIEITPNGQFKIRRDLYELIEGIFGRQSPIVSGYYVILDKIKVRKFFRLVVVNGMILEKYNVIVNESEGWWTVDAPDLYEIREEIEESEAPKDVLDMIRGLVIAMILGETPVTLERYTVIRKAVPKGRVKATCGTLYEGMVVPEIVGGTIDESTTLGVEGYSLLYISPKL